MQSTSFKLIELFALFILFPVSLALNYSYRIKLLIGVLGFLYVIYYLLKIEGTKIKISVSINWKLFWKQTMLKFLLIVFITASYVWFVDKGELFKVVATKPLFWIAIVFVYSLVSVYPQELLYRTFFFRRYQSLFKNENLFIFINAVIFCLGHLFFRNSIVIVLTFLGGLLFAFTYNKTKSTLLVSIEHAIYGSWLFTVGMGTMLGFPN